jgi:hypothetical protein
MVTAYLGLAYNLYLVAHNGVVLPPQLITRLKNRDQFWGAYHELYVMGILLRAGFTIELEDEGDINTTHCELTATWIDGQKFSVEAKIRRPNKESLNLWNQLKNALYKKAHHTRIVFIEMNVDAGETEAAQITIMRNALASIRSAEPKISIEGKPAPPAYIIVTNYPFGADKDPSFQRSAFGEGFKIPDFKAGGTFASLREVIAARDKHAPLHALLRSLADHGCVPATFDGNAPEFAFKKHEPQLIFGNHYDIPNGKDGIEAGELIEAIVITKDKLAWCVFRLLSDGRSVMATVPLSDDELFAYAAHPQTFFGELRQKPGPVTDPTDLYDTFLACYRKSSKEKLLEFFAVGGATDLEHLQHLSQEELAKTYAERMADSVWKQSGPHQKNHFDAVASVFP